MLWVFETIAGFKRAILLPPAASSSSLSNLCRPTLVFNLTSFCQKQKCDTETQCDTVWAHLYPARADFLLCANCLCAAFHQTTLSINSGSNCLRPCEIFGSSSPSSSFSYSSSCYIIPQKWPLLVLFMKRVTISRIRYYTLRLAKSDVFTPKLWEAKWIVDEVKLASWSQNFKRINLSKSSTNLIAPWASNQFRESSKGTFFWSHFLRT